MYAYTGMKILSPPSVLESNQISNNQSLEFVHHYEQPEPGNVHSPFPTFGFG
jgi:hypothetical protein